MTRVYHLNCVDIRSAAFGSVIGHCLLVETAHRLILIDAGLGLQDVQFPEQRLGAALIEQAGFELDEQKTAVRQMELLGFAADQLTDCVISHLDPDHAGGLADFPQATIHLSFEEWAHFCGGNPRYVTQHLAHKPLLKTYAASTDSWCGLEARKVFADSDLELFLVPLFGHTLGHSGVAIKLPSGWLFYVGDAYYLSAELTNWNHPVNALASLRADDDDLRIQTLTAIRQLACDYPEVEIYGYHDSAEFPWSSGNL